MGETARCEERAGRRAVPSYCCALCCCTATLTSRASPAPLAPYDLLLVGDLFYERPLAERVLAFLEAAWRQGAAVLVGDPRRSYFPNARFEPVAEYSVPVTRDLEDMEIKRTAVWRLA
jgi:predicted nicotinamide N-methyase